MLDEGDIFESKFPLVARIGLAACPGGSGIGPSLSNSVLSAKNSNPFTTAGRKTDTIFEFFRFFADMPHC